MIIRNENLNVVLLLVRCYCYRDCNEIIAALSKL